MPAAHFADLGKLLAVRANKVTAANGYDWERTSVVRRTLDEACTYDNGQIEIIEGDPTRELDVNANTNEHPRVGWSQDFIVTVCVVQSNASSTPIADDVGLAARAVLKALRLSDQLQHQAHEITVVTIEQFRAEQGAIGGALFHIRATYQTDEDDLSVVPYPAIDWNDP